MKVFYPNHVVRWNEIRIPYRDAEGDVAYISPLPDEVCVGFIPVFAHPDTIKERFPHMTVAINEAEIGNSQSPSPETQVESVSVEEVQES